MFYSMFIEIEITLWLYIYHYGKRVHVILAYAVIKTKVIVKKAKQLVKKCVIGFAMNKCM